MKGGHATIRFGLTQIDPGGTRRLNTDERIGQRVRSLRNAEEFGFDAFVEETGLGRGYVSELERGLVIPTIGTLARVAKALEVTVADLVLGESDRERLFNELRRADPKLMRELRDWLSKRLG